MVYWIVLFIGFGLLIGMAGQKLTRAIYHEITVNGWQIKFGWANQIVTSFLLLWFADGMLLFAYYSEDLRDHRQAIQILIVIVAAVCIAYAIEKKVKSVY